MVSWTLLGVALAGEPDPEMAALRLSSERIAPALSLSASAGYGVARTGGYMWLPEIGADAWWAGEWLGAVFVRVGVVPRLRFGMDL